MEETNHLMCHAKLRNPRTKKEARKMVREDGRVHFRSLTGKQLQFRLGLASAQCPFCKGISEVLSGQGQQNHKRNNS